MGEIKITGLIGENEIKAIKELDSTLERVKATYVGAATELAKGLKINVEVIGDLDKLNTLVATQAKKAQEATDQLTESVKKQNDIVEKTTNTISRELAEIEKENAKKREAYQQDKKAIDIARDILGARGQNLESLVRLNAELKSITDSQKKLTDEEKKGLISGEELIRKRQGLIERERTLKTAKNELNTILSREEKLSNAAAGSYDEMSHKLELLKRAYKQMNDAEKNGSNGQILAKEIQEADKHLKDLAADMGEFQRNTGNYAIALNDEYAPAIKNALGLNNSFAESLLSLAENGEGGGGFFENLSDKAKAFGNTLLGLLKNPVFLAVAGISAAGVAFKFWYDYNKGLVEASKLTTQFTGLQGDEMKRYRSEVQAVADVFNVDFKETLISTNAVSKQFGIEQSEALKLIKDGFVAGANANDEFLENLKEYPAYFKEAGISASEFIAITTQANKSGIYSDKAIDSIKEGNIRIREMTAATAIALDGIGISSKKVQEDLRSGATTTFDVMKKVSEKLDELPANSAAVGTAIADIFGGPGEDAGLQYLRTLKDIDVNLDTVKANAGELGEIQEDLLDSQVGLSNAMSDLFDKTGGSFEVLTTNAKIFVNDVLKDMLSYLNQIISSAELLGEQRLNKAKQQGVDAARADREWEQSTTGNIKRVADQYTKSGMSERDAFKKAKDERLAILQKSISLEESALTSYVEKNKKLNEEFENSSFWKQGIGLQKSNTEFVKDINKSFVLVENQTAALESLKEKANILNNMEYSSNNKNSGKGEEELKAEQEAAKRMLQIRRDLEESKIELMDEGLEKELKNIRIGYERRMDAITGNSNAEKAIRANLRKKMQKELSEYGEEYDNRFQKTNIENRLATVDVGTKEELDLKMEFLNMQEEAEVKSAEKSGADVTLIASKYQKQRQNLIEEHASKQILLIADNAAAEQAVRDQQYQKDMTAASEKYANDLKAGKDSVTAEEEYEESKYQITLDYTKKTTEAAINSLEQQLKATNLSTEDRAKIAEELQKTKAELAEEEAKAEIKSIKEVEKEDEKSKKKRIKNVQQWLNVASEAVGAISDLVSTVYDGKIEKIEAEQEINDEAYDRDVERTDNLVQQKVITEEEGEARKRAALEKTEAKNAELEKKKAALAYKQAVWEKATGVSQAGIATALTIMNALQTQPFPVGVALAAVAVAMGAIQVATILATPIPSYAEGTKGKDGHPGGTALVGDAGKREVVMFGGSAWITPDIPTLVDLPKGTQVFPDVDVMDFSDLEFPTISLPRPTAAESAKPVVIDYRDLKAEIKGLRWDMKAIARQQHRDAYNLEYKIQKMNNI